MLSIGKVASAAAAREYFVGTAGRCTAGYYADGRERSGRWIGSGTVEIGLDGPLDSVAGARAFEALLEGVAPDGTRLVPAVRRGDPKARVPAAPLVAAVRAAAAEAGLPVGGLLGDGPVMKEWGRAVTGLTGGDRRAAKGVRADVAVRIAETAGLDAHAVYRAADGGSGDPLAAALAHVGARVDTRRAGLDLTFSAPKSVSLLHAFARPAAAAQVEAAHVAALGQALAYLEEVAGHALRGHQGDGQRAEQIATSGFVAAAFDHGTSRAGDPQLHTHVVVANLVHGADGGWSALDTRAIHRHGKTAGYLYQAVLRGELSARLGVAWGPVAKGTAEVAGVPAKARALFSTRRTAIEASMAAHGTAGPGAAQAACLATRGGKDHATTPAQLAARWREQLAGIGLDADAIAAAALAPSDRPPVPPPAAAVARRLLAVDGLTRSATSFDRDDVMRAVCEALPPGCAVDLARVRDDTAAVIGDSAAVALDPTVTGGRQRWTSAALLATEQRALAVADHLRTTPHLPGDDRATRAITEHLGLSEEQAHLVAVLTSGRSSLSVVVGPAGAGKTRALAAAHEYWRLWGVRVTGVALSGMAARELRRGSGIGTCTVAQARAAIEKGASPLTAPGPQVLVVDEAGMVGTRDLALLLELAARHGQTHLVLVGDHRQLPEIEAGGMFARLAAQPTVVLTENRRQVAAWEQRALARLRIGRTASALDEYWARGRVTISDDPGQLVARIAAAYLDIRRDEPGGRVGILAATRAQATAINDAVRARLAAAGTLTGPALDVVTSDGARELRAGDDVVFTAPDRDRGLLNGQAATVTAVDPARERVTVRVDDGRTLSLDAEWLAGGALTHGYALTVHKAQGQTYDTALLAGSGALTAETAYTAMSRGREGNHLFLAPDAGADDDAQAWLTDTALTDAGRAMARSRRQELASELADAGARARAGRCPQPAVRRPQIPTAAPTAASGPGHAAGVAMGR